MHIPDSISNDTLLFYLEQQKFKQSESTTALLDALENCIAIANLDDFHEIDRRKIFSKVQDLFYMFS